MYMYRVATVGLGTAHTEASITRLKMAVVLSEAVHLFSSAEDGQ